MTENKEYTILIVEDSFVIAMELQLKLQNFGYKVLEPVASGEEAYEIALREMPDMMMVDIILAGKLDGIQTVEKINKEKYIPNLYMTGHADEQKIERAKKTSPLGYILKPYDDNQLRITLTMAFSKIEVDRKLMNYQNRLEKLVDERTAELKKQRDLLQRKNKAIRDSIDYAWNIQNSLLPDKKEFDSVFPQNFIIFKPRDTLSGDFYWIHQNERTVSFAVADCTGHGVPGALLSIIGHNLLNQIVVLDKIIAPNQVLHLLNKRIWDTFEKNSKKFRMSDGMDIAFCTYYKNTGRMLFAGAYRPLYLFRDGKLKSYKEDRTSIGGVSEYETVFKAHWIQLQQNDQIYLFSDGYTDQLGGHNHQKFRLKRFEHLLQEIGELPMQFQKQIIMKRYHEWIKDYDQIDDILIIGLKV